MHEKLFSFLNEAGAKFPLEDPEYDSKKEKDYLQKVINERWPQLEKQRLNYLSKDFDPGNNWWGSMVTND